MIRVIAATLIVVFAPGFGRAQNDGGSFRIGDDAYLAGSVVRIETPGIDGLFAAGERVILEAPISGSAHLVGRRVTVRADIGGDLYAAGADVTIGAPIAGNATLAGYDVAVEAALDGNLRAAGQHVRVTGPVGGTALLASETVEIDGVIEGDAAIGASELSFGPDAKINGRLILYGGKAAELAVPATVIAADRVDRHPEVSQRVADRRPSWWAVGGTLVLSVLAVAVLAAIASAIAPLGLEGSREIVRERPFRTFFIGFLSLSTLIGSAIVLALTVVGILAAPVILLIVLVMCLFGYVIGVYLLGRGVWGLFGQLPPDTFVERAAAGLIGAVLVTLLALTPILGWLALLALTLVGLGAITVGILRPEFRS